MRTLLWFAPLALAAACGAKTGLRVPPRPPRLALGRAHSCAALADGSAWCWGDSSAGQLGAVGNVALGATRVPGVAGATRLAARDDATCARRADGTVVCWGANAGGRLGTPVGGPAPVSVPGLTGVEDVAVGGFFACARLVDGTVRCWGSASCGALGFVAFDQTTDSYPPTEVPGLRDVVQLSSDSRATFARLSDGTVRYWGTICAGNVTPIVFEAEVSAPLAWIGAVTDIAAYTPYGLDITEAYVLPDGSVHGPRFDFDPVRGTTGAGTGHAAVAIDHAVEVALGLFFGCVRRIDGTVACWGDNARGQLGDGTRQYRADPVSVVGLDDAVALALGDAHACATRAGGAVVCWGANDAGQLGDGTRVDRARPVPVLGLPVVDAHPELEPGPGSPVSPATPCRPGFVTTYEPGCGRDPGGAVCRPDLAGTFRAIAFCGCDGATFVTDQFPPAQPYAYAGPCTDARAGDAVACSADSIPIDGDACSAADHDQGIRCRALGGLGPVCTDGCARQCTCGADHTWRCLEDVCLEAGAYDASAPPDPGPRCAEP